MVHRYALPDEVGLGMHFLDFTRDDDRMWKVFQFFVTNFYRRRQSTYAVRSEAFPWFSSDRHHSAPVFLPRLETDIVLADKKSKVVIDTKYSIKPLVTRRDKTTLRSTHVNQMFAYMKNVEARDHKERTVRGVLLYAAVAGSFCWDWTLFGYPLRVAAVDLGREWQEIEDQLLLLLDFDCTRTPLDHPVGVATFAG
jgi:5-methylcytosine-specific restriction enzyme subunit McrC